MSAANVCFSANVSYLLSIGAVPAVPEVYSPSLLPSSSRRTGRRIVASRYSFFALIPFSTPLIAGWFDAHAEPADTQIPLSSSACEALRSRCKSYTDGVAVCTGLIIEAMNICVRSFQYFFCKWRLYRRICSPFLPDDRSTWMPPAPCLRFPGQCLYRSAYSSAVLRRI